MYSLSVAVANLPFARTALAAELAESGTPLLPVVPLLLLFAFLRVLATATPMAIIAIAKISSIAINNFFLLGFLPGADEG